ncbi:MAG: DUF4430 domain-containing protein [Cellulosilyticaceae bacterium]
MKSDFNKLALAASLLLIKNATNPNSNMRRQTRTRSHTRGDSIIFTISGPSGETVILPETDVAISIGETVLDATLRVLEENNIPFEVAGFGKDAYILSINGIAQYEKGPQSRWLYNIDGEYPPTSPAEYYLKEDQRLEWIYTVDGGKDIGAPNVSFEQRNNNTLARM